MSDSDTDRTPIRREPPAFRRLEVRRIEDLTPRMRRIVLGGDELEGLVIDEPAASVRLLLPADDGTLVMPKWTGNQFELPSGERAPIRTFTPRRLDLDALELTIDIVVHEQGAASDWSARAKIGDEAAISGPARGHDIDATAAGHLLAGDETAIPAICQLIEAMPAAMPMTILVEIADPAARLDLHEPSGTEARWLEGASGEAPGTALVDAVRSIDPMPAAVWAAGEAAAMQKIRKHLFDERGMSRREATVRGYWKHGRSAT